MPAKPLTFALVGCGRIAARHAEQMILHGKLIGVCDIVAEKADAFAAGFNCPAWYSAEALINDSNRPDLIAVCTPNALHAAHSFAALNAGINVLCEKPMAIKTADCIAMMDAAEKNNRKLFVVKQNRYNPPVAAVKEIIDKGILGNIYSVQLNCFWNRDAAYYKNSWKGTMNMDGGILYTQFSHFIDLLYWLFGDVRKVSAFTKNFAHKGIIEFEDAGVVSLEFLNGALGSIHFTINSFKKNMEGSLTVFGEKGTVKIGGEYLNELEYQSIENYEIKDLAPGNRANNYGTYTGSMSNHDKVYEHLTKTLTGEHFTETNARDAMKTVEIIEKIYASAKQE